ERLGQDRVGLERVLQILRSDVLAARGDENVLLAIGDRQEAVLVDVSDVPRAKPPVPRKNLSRGVLVLVVAREVRLALDQHLAVLRDPQLDARQRRADCAEAVARGSVDGRARRALRQAVALENEDVERVEELDDLL